MREATLKQPEMWQCPITCEIWVGELDIDVKSVKI